jgi:hypothetical protein
MPASPQDFYKKVGANTVTTLAAPGKNLAATSINVGSTTNYPTDTGIVVGIRVVDSDGVVVPGTYSEWNGVVASSTAITIESTPVYGSDQVYTAGASTQVFLNVSSSLHNQLVDGVLVEHGQDGTHDATKVGMLAGTQTFTGDKTFSGAVVLPDDTINSDMLALSKTVDANDWTVYDYGTWLEYTYTFASWAAPLTFGATGGSNWSQSRGTLSPPVGKSWEDLDIIFSCRQSGSTSTCIPLRAMIYGSLSGTGTKSVTVFNPTAISIPNTNMGLVIQLTAKDA